MGSEDTSQSQNPMSFFSRMVDEQVDRVNHMFDEVEKWQHKGFERTERVIDEAAEASKTTLEYLEDVTREWQKMSVDTLRQTTDTLRSDG